MYDVSESVVLTKMSLADARGSRRICVTPRLGDLTQIVVIVSWLCGVSSESFIYGFSGGGLLAKIRMRTVR